MSIMDNDELPKWQRVKYDIELKIITGEYQAGERVPSVRSLAKMYGVGTSTSQTILEKLSLDGTLIMEQGIGFKVNTRAVNKLRKEHINRVKKILEQTFAYAEKLQIDPMEILQDISNSQP